MYVVEVVVRPPYDTLSIEHRDPEAISDKRSDHILSTSTHVMYVREYYHRPPKGDPKREFYPTPQTVLKSCLSHVTLLSWSDLPFRIPLWGTVNA